MSHWPDHAPGQVSVVQVLGPDAPDPSHAQLDAFAQTFARYGGYATARVVDTVLVWLPDADARSSSERWPGCRLPDSDGAPS